jgi:hypothetical protein
MSKKPPRVIPTSSNNVHKDIIHSENIKKEMKFYDFNRMEHF